MHDSTESVTTAIVCGLQSGMSRHEFACNVSHIHIPAFIFGNCKEIRFYIVMYSQAQVSMGDRCIDCPVDFKVSLAVKDRNSHYNIDINRRNKGRF